MLSTNGFPAERPDEGVWLAADATFAPGRCFIAPDPDGGDAVRVATSLATVARALAEDGVAADIDRGLLAGAAAGFCVAGTDAAHRLTRRIYQLSRALPTAPLDPFRERPPPYRTTKVGRLVIQRVGQDVFREALLDFCSGRCAVTGLDQPELLRASHMKPWAKCERDEERLDHFNGLLLAAHWNAAFDRGLITFDDAGRALASSLLAPAAHALLDLDAADRLHRFAIRAEHRPYLAFHRERVWRE